MKWWHKVGVHLPIKSVIAFIISSAIPVVTNTPPVATAVVPATAIKAGGIPPGPNCLSMAVKNLLLILFTPISQR